MKTVKYEIKRTLIVNVDKFKMKALSDFYDILRHNSHTNYNNLYLPVKFPYFSYAKEIS